MNCVSFTNSEVTSGALCQRQSVDQIGAIVENAVEYIEALLTTRTTRVDVVKHQLPFSWNDVFIFLFSILTDPRWYIENIQTLASIYSHFIFRQYAGDIFGNQITNTNKINIYKWRSNRIQLFFSIVILLRIHVQISFTKNYNPQFRSI